MGVQMSSVAALTDGMFPLIDYPDLKELMGRESDDMYEDGRF